MSVSIITNVTSSPYSALVVVRAVAALLHRYGALKSFARAGFDEDFKLVVNSS